MLALCERSGFRPNVGNRGARAFEPEQAGDGGRRGGGQEQPGPGRAAGGQQGRQAGAERLAEVPGELAVQYPTRPAWASRQTGTTSQLRSASRKAAWASAESASARAATFRAP